MPARTSAHPTEAELEILSILWRRGPSTVRDVHDELNRHTPTGYTTVLKLLQIMTEKGLVVRDETALSEQKLIAHCGERLVDYQRPTEVRFVEALPRNAMGKVLRRELQGQFQEQ